MARTYKRTRLLRSPEEKERIILEYFNGKYPSQRKICEKYDLDDRLFRRWIKKYRNFGIQGLVSQTGKSSKSTGRPRKPKNREQELELENMKLKIEVARLKKGYQVKGVGSKKEYVTIKDLNSKS